MSRTFRILTAFAVFGSCLAAALSGAIVARAASTVRAETPLLDAPSWDAGVVLTLPAGAEIAIAGAPDGAFLPVQAGEVFGWVPGSVVAVEKAPQPASQWEEPGPASAAQPVEGEPATEELPSAPPTTGPADPGASVADAAPESNADAPTGATAETPPVVTPTPAAGPPPAPGTDAAEGAAPPATDATEEPSPAGVDAGSTPAPPPAATTTPTAGDPGAAPTAVTPDPAGEPAATASPTASPQTSPAAPTQPTPPPPATSTAAPSPSPTATPVPTPGPLVDGQATVSTDAGLFEWPGFDAPIVFMVPAGSLVNLQGDARNGFVQAEFMWMYGWIADDLLQPAAPPEGETIPDDAEEEDVRTPRAGSGLAFATVDLTMRAGPSGGEDAVGSVPAGARVELTGVMQNDFQRVIYQDQIGWIANEFLQLPATPTPEPSGKGNGRNGSNAQKQYSERQIIRIISNAADRYGQNREDMLRVARCESGLDPYAVNPSGSYGLFQFIRSTWKSTPYGNEDIFDPVANANAAGWMWKEGRKSEWVCK